jgi:hypothetical protein
MKKRMRDVPTSHRVSPSRSSPRHKKEDEGERKVLSETVIYRPTLPSPKEILSSSPLILATTARILEVIKKEETPSNLTPYINLPTVEIATILKPDQQEVVKSFQKSINNQLPIPSSPRTTIHLSSSSSSSSSTSIKPLHFLSSSSIKSLHAATRDIVKNISELDKESQNAYSATVSRLSHRAFQEHATFIDIDTSPKKDNNDQDEDDDLSIIDLSCHNSSIPSIVRKSSHSLILSGRRTEDDISEIKKREKERDSDIVTVQVMKEKDKDKEIAEALFDTSTTISITSATQRSAIALERLSKDHLNIELITELQAAVEDLNQALLLNVV